MNAATKKDLPFFKYPGFAKCSVNICPRHPNHPDLLVDYEDKEKKCGVAKSIRLGVSSEFPGVLKLEGLTLREYTAKKKWGSMTPDEQNVRKNQMANVRAHIASKDKDIESPRIV